MSTASPTVAEAIAFLVEIGVTEASAVRYGPDGPLTGIAPDVDAGPEAAAWLSEKALAAHPERLDEFRGRLLIAPDSAAAARVPSTATVVRAAEPRIAFSRLVARFFAAASVPGWPPHDGPVPDDARIGRDVRLAAGVVLGAGVEIGDGCVIGPHTCLAHCTLSAGVEIGAHCTVGGSGFGYTRGGDGHLIPFPHVGRVVIGEGVAIGDHTCVDRGALGDTVIGAGTKVDNLVHIAHNVRIGCDCLVIAQAMIGGSATVGDAVWIAPGAQLINGVRVGDGATVGMGAVVIRDVAAGATVAGNPARPLR